MPRENFIRRKPSVWFFVQLSLRRFASQRKPVARTNPTGAVSKKVNVATKRGVCSGNQPGAIAENTTNASRTAHATKYICAACGARLSSVAAFGLPGFGCGCGRCFRSSHHQTTQPQIAIAYHANNQPENIDSSSGA